MHWETCKEVYPYATYRNDCKPKPIPEYSSSSPLTWSLSQKYLVNGKCYRPRVFAQGRVYSGLEVSQVDNALSVLSNGRSSKGSFWCHMIVIIPLFILPSNVEETWQKPWFYFHHNTSAMRFTDPTYPLFPVFALIGFVLCLIPLPWHLQAWNSGTCAFMIWTASLCLVEFINAIVWSGNVDNVAPIWCDICKFQF